ncbi:MAG: alanine:cation symporter family protein, partial [Amphiplicatus sp.]
MAQSGGLAERIDQAFGPISDAVNAVIFYSVRIGGVDLPLVVIWLIGAAAIITVSLGFINLRGFRHALSIVTRKRSHEGDGQITHFEALSSALSGTVGLGNIASVPVAIALGGPGALFWMILAGFLGMSSKFAECALAVKYRKVRPDGRIIGGPMFYIEHVFAKRGLAPIGKAAAIFFAVMAMGASVSVFQVNQSYAQFSNVLGITDPNAPIVFGVIMAGLVAVVILGGIPRIARVSSL